jgi:predicted RNase H-like HicB family nuclease
MRTFSAVVERCPETKLLVGFVPGFPGAHSQGETLEELNSNLQEVIAMLLDDDDIEPNSAVNWTVCTLSVSAGSNFER